ncbi:hypothetical protein HK097_009361 [Rhizophlyctis rosea]|uniref:Uncharacterized protein n=1 Tax=Rhizophlyctis rosea TaxID=64517 RepID=A0AAD5SBE5_9FUNG|nr:hypothetical protein HK097_009361 [Rhizophlyctis rosea]
MDSANLPVKRPLAGAGDVLRKRMKPNEVTVHDVPALVQAIQLQLNKLTVSMNECLADFSFFAHWHSECQQLKDKKVLPTATIALVGGSEEGIGRLNLLVGDLLNEEGAMPNVGELQVLRGARAKALKAVQAIFPKIPPEEYSIEKFMQQEEVESVLGCLRHKWGVLSPGIVLVDLPGGGDANPARAAIAEGYLQKADKVFVVARIHRAVNQKMADDYLTSAVRHELTMGGRSKSVAYICTAIDQMPRADFKDDIKRYKLEDVWEMINKQKIVEEGAIEASNLKAREKKAALKVVKKEAEDRMTFQCIQVRNERVKEAKCRSFVAS